MLFLAMVILMVCMLAMLLPAALNRRSIRLDNPEAQNALIARQRIEEAENQSPLGETLKRIELEVQETLVDDIQAPQDAPLERISPALSLSIIGLVSLLSVVIYGYIGTPFAMHEVNTPMAQDAAPDLENLLERLEERNREDPDNPKGWELAARTWMSLENYDKAVTAYENLNRLVPGNPDYLAGWADSIIMDNGNNYVAEAENAVEAALRINPQHLNALWIKALGLRSRQQYAESNVYLERLLPLLETNPDATENINALINGNLANLQVEGEIADGPVSQESQPDAQTTVGGRQISVSVDVSDELTGRLKEFKAVYIIARAKNGPPAPLAVSRHLPSELPLSVVLTGEMAMMPGMDINAFDDIEIVARLSASGNPVSEPGDFESAVQQVALENIDSQFRLTIENSL